MIVESDEVLLADTFLGAQEFGQPWARFRGRMPCAPTVGAFDLTRDIPVLYWTPIEIASLADQATRLGRDVRRATGRKRL